MQKRLHPFFLKQSIIRRKIAWGSKRKKGKFKNNNANSNQTENGSNSVTKRNDNISQDRDSEIDKSTTSANSTAALIVAKEASKKESGARNPRSTLAIAKKIFQIFLSIDKNISSIDNEKKPQT